MVSLDEALQLLKCKAVPENIPGMKRYGMSEEGRLGVSVPEMRAIAKKLGKNHLLAQQLWDSGYAEARILASMVDEPEVLSEEQMDRWVQELNSWDVCDQVCMNLFEKSPLAWKKIPEWSRREEEFVRRASMALVACLAWHDKGELNEAFIELMPVIENCALDERNYVKKAVSWALRNIGKRNNQLNQAAIRQAEALQESDSKAAQWIAADVLRELRGEAVQKRLK